MNLLQFTTAGDVDNGKSTLIGRLLFDTNSIYEDQLENIKRLSRKKGHLNIDLSLVTDGLKDEMEQAITIDVAHYYFSTANRKFIITDCPGHIQYTKNMLTGASSADVLLLLVDVQTGITKQVIKHLQIASLLRIGYVVVCVNKMDAVFFEKSNFDTVVESIQPLLSQMKFEDVIFLPICASKGDNVVFPSLNMPWYTSNTLIQILETAPILSSNNQLKPLRLPIQGTITKPVDMEGSPNLYYGKILSGELEVGKEICTSSKQLCRISEIYIGEDKLKKATAPLSVSFAFTELIKLNREDLLFDNANKPRNDKGIDAIVCWLSSTPLSTTDNYIIKTAVLETTIQVVAIIEKIELEDNPVSDSEKVSLNDVAKINCLLAQPIYFDLPYDNIKMAEFILMDTITNETVAAGFFN